MVNEATVNPLRLGMSPEGDQILMLEDKKKTLTEAEVDNLINGLTTGKEFTRQYKAALKSINTIQKQFNGTGRAVSDKKLTGVQELVKEIDNGEHP